MKVKTQIWYFSEEIFNDWVEAESNSRQFCEPTSVAVVEYFQNDVSAKANEKFDYISVFNLVDMPTKEKFYWVEGKEKTNWKQSSPSLTTFPAEVLVDIASFPFFRYCRNKINSLKLYYECLFMSEMVSHKF